MKSKSLLVLPAVAFCVCCAPTLSSSEDSSSTTRAPYEGTVEWGFSSSAADVVVHGETPVKGVQAEFDVEEPRFALHSACDLIFAGHIYPEDGLHFDFDPSFIRITQASEGLWFEPGETIRGWGNGFNVVFDKVGSSSLRLMRGEELIKELPFTCYDGSIDVYAAETPDYYLYGDDLSIHVIEDYANYDPALSIDFIEDPAFFDEHFLLLYQYHFQDTMGVPCSDGKTLCLPIYRNYDDRIFSFEFRRIAIGISKQSLSDIALTYSHEYDGFPFLIDDPWH